MLLSAMLLMGGATTLVGLMPSYDTVGELAPILLVLLRFLQGLAIGGQWGGAVADGDRVRPGRQARPVREPGAARGAGRDPARQRRLPHALDPPDAGAVPGVGLAGALPRQLRAGHPDRVHGLAGRGDASVQGHPEPHRRGQRRTVAGDPGAAPGPGPGHPGRRHLHGRQRCLLRPGHRHARLHRPGAGPGPQCDALRGHHRVRRPAGRGTPVRDRLRPGRPAAGVLLRRGVCSRSGASR